MIQTATQAWHMQLAKILEAGEECVVRDMRTIELINSHISINMLFPEVNNPIRKLSRAFQYAEAHWILSGDNKVRPISRFAPSIAAFSDNGLYFQGAYGPRVTEQLQHVFNVLHKAPYSRQAIISIWRPSPPMSKDIPCTISMQFLLRDDMLHCIANMRSSDIWLGLPYDIFNFTMIANMVKLYLNKTYKNSYALGTLYLNLGSSHLYAKNLQGAKNCMNWYGSHSVPENTCPMAVNRWWAPDTFLDALKAEALNYEEELQTPS